MSRDKKNKTTKKRHKWLEILRWVLIVVLLVVGLALFFNKSIRNTVIAWNTNKYQVSNVSKKTIEKNKEAKTSFDFENVQSISTGSVLQAQMDAQKLFSPLDRAKKGMKIYLTDKNKVYTYVISEVTVVQPTEVAVVDDTPGKSEVTLVTCTDAEATQRTIVKGVLKTQVEYDKANSDIIDAFNKSYNQIQS